MELSKYQNLAVALAIYPPENGLQYLALGVIDEAGEVAGKVKKYFRGDKDYETMKEEIVPELGDVLWYLANLAHYLDIDMEEVAQRNITKLTSRKERGTRKGDGDER